MTIRADEVPAERWAQLGHALRIRRISLGYPSLRGFRIARARSEPAVLSPRILSDIESGTPGNYVDNTLVRVEHMYRLPSSGPGAPRGAVEDFLRSLDPDPELAVLPASPERPAEPATPADLLGQIGITPEDLRATVRTLSALEGLTGRRRVG